MIDLYEALSGLMLSHLWLGLALCALLLVVTRVRTRDSAAKRHNAWLVVLIVMTAMPALALLPEVPDRISTRIVERIVLSEIDANVIADVVAAPLPASVDNANAARSDGPEGWPIFAMVAVLVWFVVAGWQIHALFRAFRGARRLRRSSRPVPIEIQKAASKLASKLQLRRGVPIRWSDEAPSPQTNGAVRPWVLLPARWERGVDPDVLEHALAHELAHIKRRDPWVVWLQFAARILFGFNPAVWFAIDQLGRERESACDDWALRLGAKPKAYAGSLVAVAESLIPAPVSLTAPELSVSCLRSRHHLRRRISHMLDRRRDHSTRSVGLIVIVAAVVTVAGAAAAAPGWTGLRSVLGHLPAMIASHTSHAEGREARAERRRHRVSDREPRETDALLYAAWVGDATLAEQLIAGGEDPDEVWDRDPRTPLIAAARKGHWGIMQQLLDAGADVNYHARGDETALMATARHGASDMVSYLIERGADAESVVKGDGTPLIAAARSGDVETVRRLLQAGADPDRYVRGDEAPLYHAVIRGHHQIAAMLLDAGADPSAEYDGDGTPLMLAIQHGHADIANLLLTAGARVDTRMDGDGTALIAAARINDVATTEMLIATGADVNLSVRGDGNPLINAAGRGHLEVASLLLGAGAAVNVHVRGDDTPLINAVRSQNPELVRLLLEQGADPNLPGDYDRQIRADRTPLNQARNDSEIMSMLIAAGANS